MTSRPSGDDFERPRYELLVKIASGGMGSVYVARVRGALGFESLVAVKRPHGFLLEQDSFRKDLIAEARIASRIRHSNVVRVHDVAVDGPLVLLVMEYVEGASLAQLAAQGAIPIPIALRIALDACAGLHAAHEAVGEDNQPLGVVHRDVSPQNILVGVDGVAKLTDFGIAKCLNVKDETTQGQVKGKLSYVAPEYVSGGKVDRRSDVFGLGVVVWELLTDEQPFRGNHDAETISRVLSRDPPPPSTVNPLVPGSLDATTLHALAKDPSARPPTAEAFGEALEFAARGAGVLASHKDVSLWVRDRAAEALADRAKAIRGAEDDPSTANFEPGAAVSAADEAPKEEPAVAVVAPQRATAPVRGEEPTMRSEHVVEPSVQPHVSTAEPAVSPVEKRSRPVGVLLVGLGLVAVMVVMLVVRQGQTTTRTEGPMTAASLPAVSLSPVTPPPSLAPSATVIAPSTPSATVKTEHRRPRPTRPPTSATAAGSGVPLSEGRR